MIIYGGFLKWGGTPHHPKLDHGHLPKDATPNITKSAPAPKALQTSPGQVHLGLCQRLVRRKLVPRV